MLLRLSLFEFVVCTLEPYVHTCTFVGRRSLSNSSSPTLSLPYIPHLYVHVYICMQLRANTELSVELSYYNIRTDSWEPILEPVVDPSDPLKYVSWGMTAEVITKACSHARAHAKGTCACMCINVDMYWNGAVVE